MYSNNKETYSPPPAFKSPSDLCDLDSNSAILVGFSGGADSTALLHILSNYVKKSGAKLYAAHVNHGIRGGEADRDESFCRSFAKELGVDFFSIKVDVPAIAQDMGESVETAARKIRYEFFDDLMKKYHIPILATAHNADDNLETVIFNLCRGSGLSGICGIPESRPCTYGIVLRPILGMGKSEIIEYCRRNNLSFVTDSTNANTDYTRNKIRNDVIPTLKQINPGAVKNAYRTSENLRADSIYLENITDEFIHNLGDNSSIDIKKLCEASPSISSRALIRLYSEISEGASIEASHIDALRLLAKKAVPHSKTSLPNEIEGVIENGKLCLRKIQKEATVGEYNIVLCNGKNVISQIKSELFMGSSQSEKNIYKKSTLLSIDFDNINGELTARNRRAGDKIRIGGMSKSLKKLMCDKKIPIETRARLPIICDSKGIVAVPFVGIRDGARYDKEKSNKLSKFDIYFYLY